MTRAKTEEIHSLKRRGRWQRKQALIRVLGWLGGLLLGMCAIPQVWLSVSQGHSQGVSGAFITMWGVGEIFTLIYVLKTREGVDGPLVFNYLTNLSCIAIIGWYMI